MLSNLNKRWLMNLMAIALVVFSCKEELDPILPVAADFEIETDAADFSKITFKNKSLNFVSLSWDFGDGSAASIEENPVHIYAPGTYTAKLTATGADAKTSEKTLEITITDPDAELKKLTGETSKSWKLIRDVSTEQFPMQVGPTARNEIWWAFGRNNDLSDRDCLLNDEFIFSLDGTYEYKTNGDVWADEGVFAAPFGCKSSSDPETFKNVDGVDISAWGDGTHEFEYDVEAKTLQVIGEGAFVALQKAATSTEVIVPQASVTYKVVSLTDAEVDTLVLETTTANGYWRFVLVHYDNASQEPPMPAPAPVAGFTYEVDGTTVTFTNSSTDAVSYAWDFGDTHTSTEANPVHTFASGSTYTVTLVATNSFGSDEESQAIVIGGTACTPDEAESLDPATGIKLTLETAGDHSVFGGFDGVVGGRVENPYVSGINQSCFVNQFHKVTAGCQSWNGAAVGLETAINFATDKKKFKIKVYAVSKTTDVVLRLERLAFPDTDPSAERTQTIPTVGEWHELTFDFSDITDPNTYKNLVIYFEKGSCEEELFYYFDDLQQVD